MIAIRTLELNRPFEVPTEVENYEAVRFYCSRDGQIVGHFTLWHKGQPISYNQMVEAFSRQMGQHLLWPLFDPQLNLSKADLWPELHRLVREQLGLEIVQDEPEVAPVPPPPGLPLPRPDLTVSVTIPSRDRPQDLRKCLESLTRHRSQTPFEIVVADNNPASGLTEPVVRTFEGVVYVGEPRPGVTFARNAAALHARGDIIVCTDDDVTFAEGWLDNLIAPYADPQVTAVSGMVRPIELEHQAQYWFEQYGSLTRNYRRTRFDRRFFDNPPDFLPMVPAWDVGVTANFSFRAEILADPEIGPFDDELRIAEDPYLIYRILKADRVIVYEPKALVYHRHRATKEGLARQLYNYGRSSTGMQLRTFFVDGDWRGLQCLWGVAKYDWQRVMERLPSRKVPLPLKLYLKLRPARISYTGPLRGQTDFPISLVLAETKGHLVGPYSLLKSIFQVRTKLDRYTWQQFAQAQAARKSQERLCESLLELSS